MGRLTLADLSILGAVGAYLLPIAIAKYGAWKSYDNSKPRDEKFYENPVRARALGAHMNGLEGFAFFAAAVIIAQMRGAPQMMVDDLAVTYLVLRLAYVALYIGDRPTLRSAAWGLGLLVNIGILLSPLLA